MRMVVIGIICIIRISLISAVSELYEPAVGEGDACLSAGGAGMSLPLPRGSDS